MTPRIFDTVGGIIQRNGVAMESECKMQNAKLMRIFDLIRSKIFI